MLYEVIVIYKKLNEKGLEKEYKEQILVDNCDICSEVELKVLQLFNGKASCICIKQSKIREVAYEMEDANKQKYYKVFIKQDFVDDNGNSKELKYPVLIASHSTLDATQRAKEYIKQGYNNMYLGDITETKIIEYIK